MYPLLAPIVCGIGFMLWAGFPEAPLPWKTLSDAGKWMFILGLGFTLYFYGGR